MTNISSRPAWVTGQNGPLLKRPQDKTPPPPGKLQRPPVRLTVTLPRDSAYHVYAYDARMITGRARVA